MTTFTQNLILGFIISMSVVVVTRHFFGEWSNRQLLTFITFLRAQKAPLIQWFGKALHRLLTKKTAGDCSGGCTSCGACPTLQTASQTRSPTAKDELSRVVTLYESPSSTPAKSQ
ncbi:DUF6587 family protein [Spongiibacter sp. IMCC21906]|uniref:DUF6587 family protein n=1 Tax=Spongiibacter sp. IMCC21906 TaxID=1620392 RepID=UPI0012E07DF4|nr:DUF6587 family protein [Spongiibacter sp. IMCC21906]